jgi:hypothetical protein
VDNKTSKVGIGSLSSNLYQSLGSRIDKKKHDLNYFIACK